MKRFIFHLQPLLDKRIREEQDIERKLAAINAQILKTKDLMASIHTQLKSMQENEKKKRLHDQSVTELRFSVSYRNKLKLDLIKTGQQLENFFTSARDIQAQLAKATQNKKTLEILKDQRLLEWKKELKRLEQIFVDDTAQQMFIRNRSNS